MLKIFDLVAQVAPSRSTVLLQGESGTGKELIAKAIHLNSPRHDRPFVPVNTGSMPPDLLESTLFGHVKGAFTSAIASKKGLFEIADRGTLFLDEIGTMSMDTQSKILPRMLQDRKFMHLGGVHELAGGRAHHCRHECRPQAARAGRQISRGSFLPLERHHHRSSRPCANARKIFPCVDFFLDLYCWKKMNAPCVRRMTPGSAATSAGVFLAGKCARTGERDRTCRRALLRSADRP